jgi:ABC-2 type transport system permease protein
MTGISNRIAVFRKYRFLLYNLVMKDFKLKYRRSVLGILWSMLNPLLMMFVITLVFAEIFRFDDEFFAVYYLTGWLIFNLVVEGTTGAMGSIMGGGSLIKKVYIPKYIFPLEKCLFALVNTLFAMIPIFAVMAFLGMPIRPTVLLFWIPMFYTLIFSIGFGMILATLAVFFRDITHLYAVWTTAWMFLTPIIYPAELVSESMRSVLRFNPLFHYVRMFRDLMIDGTPPNLRAHFICAAISGMFLLTGLLVFKWKQGRFILYM